MTGDKNNPTRKADWVGTASGGLPVVTAAGYAYSLQDMEFNGQDKY